MKLIFKIASTTDIPEIISIADRTWKQTYRGIISDAQIEFMYSNNYTAEAIANQINDGHIYALAFEGDIALGFASYSQPAQDIVRIHKLYVLPDTQGKGVGRFLIDSVSEQAKTLGASILELNVNRYNKAKVFYEKIGFEISQEVDIPYGDFVLNDYVMRRPIV
ncbi:GNAT family N-acetyltransferase [Solitalea lacus]|uniref:GNAT family N-acetyltransferase n=1 Tax=Solitalea lacus TaxID=2911172 RepID=UPI001EDA31AF|nr:GNAT family N-acetyltransferase [Solitalea lacus]UKJ07604.1 GNAT family N-acetyltransferase [Solitalea lacus]